jgi:K(+)-stimulated pyrophosphate-energized sodium pump
MTASAALSTVQVTGSNLNITYVVLAVALGALAIAFALRQQVLAASDGTDKMREIAEAVQEGAAAYLARQFRTLSYFVGIVFFLTLRTSSRYHCDPHWSLHLLPYGRRILGTRWI